MNSKIAATVIIFLWLTNYQANLFGQKAAQIDSLKTELAKASVDTQRIKVLLSLSMSYQGYQTDSAMAYAWATLEESERIGYTKGRADALLHVGRLKRDLEKTAEAMDEMFTALKLYREIDDKPQIANALNDISIIYANSGDNQNSLDYFEQALEIFRETGDEKGESYALNNIGIIHQRLGNESKARDYFIQSLTIKERNRDLYGISRGYINLGSIAENNQRWDEALAYYFKADSLLDKTNDTQARAGNFVSIAKIKDTQHKSDEARRFAMLGLEKGKEVKSLGTMLNASKLLADIDEKRNNYKSALAYQKLYNEMADSLNSENHRAKLEELKGRFNLDEKEREIAFLKKDQELQRAVVERKNIIAYSLGVGVVFMLLISGLIYYAYRTTKSKKDSLAFKNHEIEQQKNDLDKLNKEKDRFFSILSHDLRAPLSSLKGLSHLVTNHADSLTREELDEIRTKIDTSLDNLTELINNILEWSMTSSQNRKWTFDKVNTADLVRKNISLYKTIAESKGVNLVFQPIDDLHGYADYQAVDTVIRNLISNSIKFSHANKDVMISTFKKENTVCISVKDEGIGIPLEAQDKLFTLNRKVTQPGTNNEKGIGIGLTLCKELMKENNGDIQVSSTPGKGSEFVISLPVDH